MFGGEYDCNKCKRPGCLKNSQYIRLRNVPTKCPLHDRAILLTRENIWFYYNLVQLHIPGDKLLISYINSFLGVCPKSILDNRVYELLNRYFYCKNNNTQPFPGSYDDQPSDWLFLSNVIGDKLKKKELEDIRSKRR